MTRLHLYRVPFVAFLCWCVCVCVCGGCWFISTLYSSIDSIRGGLFRFSHPISPSHLKSVSVLLVLEHKKRRKFFCLETLFKTSQIINEKQNTCRLFIGVSYLRKTFTFLLIRKFSDFYYQQSTFIDNLKKSRARRQDLDSTISLKRNNSE